jgi:hypothetical protein
MIYQHQVGRVMVVAACLHANHEPTVPVWRRHEHTHSEAPERGTDYDRTLILAAQTAATAEMKYW